jgi:GntR family histidine utilization transcriptional repressor
MTVNKALMQLARNGLIERRRKSGSFVRQPQTQSAVLEIGDIRADVEAMGFAYRYVILASRRRTASAIDRQRLSAEFGYPVLALQCLHLASEKPFCFEDRIINLARVPEAAEADFAERSPGPWLLERVPWSSAEHRIRAISADIRTADLLQLRPGAACLVVERRTWLENAPVTQVRLAWPADRHELVAGFSPTDRD